MTAAIKKPGTPSRNPALEQVGAQEAGRRTQAQVRDPRATPAAMQLERLDAAVLLHPRHLIGQIEVAGVLEVARQLLHASGHAHPPVRIAAGPAPARAAEDAQLPVGVEVAVADPAAEMAGDPVQLDAVELGGIAGEPLAQAGGERRRERLVRVQRHHPVRFDLVEREVLLLDVSLVGVAQRARPRPPGQLLGRIAAALVDHDHDLVGPGERRQAMLDPERVVAGDHAGADRRHHVRRRATDRIPLIRPISFITAFNVVTSFTHRS